MDANREHGVAPGALAETDCLDEARRRLRRSGLFRGHEDAIELELMNGRLVLTGRVPSFYLKQVLQVCLRDLPGIKRVQNDVDVVSCAGLSSEPRHEQPVLPESQRVNLARRASRPHPSAAATFSTKGARP